MKFLTFSFCLVLAINVYCQDANEKIVIDKFSEYIAPRLDGHEFTYKIFKSDLNSDSMSDYVLDYCIQATDEDRDVGGGNAMMNYRCVQEGIAIFIQKGGKFIFEKDVDKSEFSSYEDVFFDVDEVYGNTIICEGTRYDKEDPRCCPSLRKVYRLTYSNGDLYK